MDDLYMPKVIMIRYSELNLKSEGVKKHFLSLLKRNLRSAMQDNGIRGPKIVQLHGRFIIRDTHKQILEKALPYLRNVFGVDSLSLADDYSFHDLKDLHTQIFMLGTDYFGVTEGTFAVRVSRAGSHDFSSKDAEILLGSALDVQSNKVKLNNPDVTVGLDIRNRHAYIFTEKISGSGGMPIGSGGKALALFSGGIDSPVAAYLAMKRGLEIDYLFYNPIGSVFKEKAVKVLKHLTKYYCYGYEPKIFLLDGKDIDKTIKQETPPKLRQIVFKIILYKIAEQISDQHNYHGIITGESLAQKSSQTLQNLETINSFSSKLVLRPLIAMDKKEIIEIARKIGTMELSEQVPEICRLSEGPAATHASEKDIPSLEKFDQLIIETVKKCEAVKVSELSIAENTLSRPELHPSKSLLIDTRTDQVKLIKPLASDLQIPAGDFFNHKKLAKILNRLDKSKTYLLVCTQGNKAEEAAAVLEQKGINAQGMSYDKISKKSK